MTSQNEQMRAINAEARKLAEPDIFIPAAVYDRLIVELTKVRSAGCAMTGQFDSDVFRVALGEAANIWPDTIGLDVINANARKIAAGRTPAELAAMVERFPATDR